MVTIRAARFAAISWRRSILVATLLAMQLGDTVNAMMPSFAEFDQRAREGQRLIVVFFGGSLTWGAQASDPQHTSYRALISQRLEARYPDAHFAFRDSAIGGTTSQLGACRLDRDVLQHRPDLVFLDFTVNDGPDASPSIEKLAAYEAIVHRLTAAGIPVVQAIFAVRKDVERSAHGDYPHRPLDAHHKQISATYGTALGDAVALMRQHVENGHATPEDLWPMTPDVTHPGDRGYALYAEAVWQAYIAAVDHQLTGRLPARMLHPSTYLNVQRLRISQYNPLPTGWRIGQPQRTAVAHDFLMSRWLDDVVIAVRPTEDAPMPEPLQFRFRGQSILIFGQTTEQSGIYAVKIDDQPTFEVDVGAVGRRIRGNMHHVKVLAEGLNPAVSHVITITPKLEPQQDLVFESLIFAGDKAGPLE